MMLHTLLPKAHGKFRDLRDLPLLVPVVDGFDDWMAANGHTPGSREFAIPTLTHIAADLRRRSVAEQRWHDSGLVGVTIAAEKCGVAAIESQCLQAFCAATPHY
jgi:hypothetical protein